MESTYTIHDTMTAGPAEIHSHIFPLAADSDDPRDLINYKRHLTIQQSHEKSFLAAHPGNKLCHGHRIYNKKHYPLAVRATMRDVHHPRYSKYKLPDRMNLQSHSPNSSLLSLHGGDVPVNGDGVGAFDSPTAIGSPGGSPNYPVHDRSPPIVKLTLRGGRGSNAGDDDDDGDFRPDHDSDEDFQPKAQGPKRTIKQTTKPTAKKPAKRSRRVPQKETLSSRASKYVSIAVPKGPPSFDIDKELLDRGIHIDDCCGAFQSFYKAVTVHGVQERSGIAYHERYTPQLDTAEKVLQLPPYKPEVRHYELLEDQVALIPHTQPDETIVKRWDVRVRNTKDLTAAEVDVFLLPWVWIDRRKCKLCGKTNRPRVECVRHDKYSACQRCIDLGQEEECKAELAATRVRFAVLTEEVCPDKTLVLALAGITVQLMNRFAADLMIDQWEIMTLWTSSKTSSRIVCREQRFIHVTALIEFKDQYWPTFDLNTLPELDATRMRGPQRYSGRLWSINYYGACPFVISNSGGVLVADRWPAVYLTDVTREDQWRFDESGKGLRTHPSDVDHLAIDAAESLQDSYFIFGPRTSEMPSGPLPTGQSRENTARAIKLIRICAHKMTGMMGTLRGVRQAFEDLITGFMVNKTLARGGPYRNGSLLTFRLRQSHWSLHWSNHIYDELECRDGSDPSTIISRSAWRLDQKDYFSLVWAAQQALNALSRGDDLIRILFAGIIALHDINHARITRAQMIESFCQCTTKTAAHTLHICTSCGTIRICKKLEKEVTDEGVLVKCAGCVGHPFGQRLGDEQEGFLLTATLEYLAERCVTLERRDHQPAYTSDDLYTALLFTAQVPEDPFSYVCGYSGQTISIPDTRPKHGISHPESISIERPFLRYLLQDNTLVLHYPIVNVVCVKFAINMMKGPHPPAYLPLLRAAVLLNEEVKGQSPCVGYPEIVRVRFNKLHRIADHIHAIKKVCPSTDKARIQAGQNTAAIARCIQQEKTGVWSGEATRVQLNRLFALTRFDKRPTKFMNEDWDSIVLQKNLSEMEGDLTFNPHGLAIPRLGKYGIPWFWHSDLITEESDYDWSWLYALFAVRCRRMVENCDSHHDHPDESPATLFLEYAVQFLKFGGKCHVFGWTMSPFADHPTSFSTGRAVSQSQSNGTIRYLQPGSQMQTGCTTKLPRNMRSDYDFYRSTIIFESWVANRLRYRFFSEDSLLPLLKKIVKEIQPSCIWYDALLPSIDSYFPIPYPAGKDRRGYNRALRTYLEDVRGSTIAEGDDTREKEIDDEEEYYEEHTQQIEKELHPTKHYQRVYEELLKQIQVYDLSEDPDVARMLSTISDLLTDDADVDEVACENALAGLNRILKGRIAQYLTLDTSQPAGEEDDGVGHDDAHIDAGSQQQIHISTMLLSMTVVGMTEGPQPDRGRKAQGARSRHSEQHQHLQALPDSNDITSPFTVADTDAASDDEFIPIETILQGKASLAHTQHGPTDETAKDSAMQGKRKALEAMLQPLEEDDIIEMMVRREADKLRKKFRSMPAADRISRLASMMMEAKHAEDEDI